LCCSFVVAVDVFSAAVVVIDVPARICLVCNFESLHAGPRRIQAGPFFLGSWLSLNKAKFKLDEDEPRVKSWVFLKFFLV
jgi:hypothetical protein